MKINSNTVMLDPTQYSSIEDILKKIAQDNSVKNVESISIKLSSDQAIVSFRQKEAIAGEIGAFLGNLIAGEGIGQGTGTLLGDVVEEGGINISKLLASGGGQYLGNWIGEAFGMPGLGQYLGGEAGKWALEKLMPLIQNATTEQEAKGVIEQAVQQDPELQKLVQEVS